MTEKYRDKLVPLVKKDPKAAYGEVLMEFEGPNLVWLDIANETKDQISISLKIIDAKQKISALLIGEAPIPPGAFLTVFAHKLIIDKTVAVRASNNAVVYFSSKRDDL